MDSKVIQQVLPKVLSATESGRALWQKYGEGYALPWSRDLKLVIERIRQYEEPDYVASIRRANGTTMESLSSDDGETWTALNELFELVRMRVEGIADALASLEEVLDDPTAVIGIDEDGVPFRVQSASVADDDIPF